MQLHLDWCPPTPPSGASARHPPANRMLKAGRLKTTEKLASLRSLTSVEMEVGGSTPSGCTNKPAQGPDAKRRDSHFDIEVNFTWFVNFSRNGSWGFSAFAKHRLRRTGTPSGCTIDYRLQNVRFLHPDAFCRDGLHGFSAWLLNPQSEIGNRQFLRGIGSPRIHFAPPQTSLDSLWVHN